MISSFRKVFKNYTGWILTHGGLLPMATILLIKPQYYQPILVYSGYIAVGFLVMILLLNPLKHFFPTKIFLKKINLYRREIGVACFSYAFLHMICFITKRGGVMETLPFLLHPAIGPTMIIALPILGILTYTSRNSVIKKMGFLKWKKLHKTIYIAEVIIFLHMIIVGETFYACLFFLPLFSVQLLKKYSKSLTLSKGFQDAQGSINKI